MTEAVGRPAMGSRLVDAALALLVGGLTLLVAAGEWGARASIPVTVILVLAGGAVLVTGRRRREDPLPVVVALLGAAAILVWLGASADPALLLALFLAQAYEQRARVRWVLVGVASVVLVLTALRDDGWSGALSAALYGLAVLGWGQGVRSARLYQEGLLQRAADAERERDLRAAQAVAEERARIARDVHDIVSHSLAVIVVQATGAERVADRRPELARDALGVIGTTARGALTEMRALLHVLREGDSTPDSDAPSPGLAEFETLAADMSSRGLTVRTSVAGDPFPIGAGAQLALYRVVQEALTNALKHGDRAGVTTVGVVYEPQAVSVEVANPVAQDEGGGDDVPGSGAGLRGMRERLSLYQGLVRSGPSDGVFRVVATIPRSSLDGSGGREEEQ